MQFGLLHATSDQEFTEKSASAISALLRFIIDQKGSATLGLCGGSTPKHVYEALGKDTGIDWSKVTVFLIDERYVEADHPDSNQKMIRETLLAYAKVPEAQQVFPDVTLPLPFCLSDYDARIKDMLSGDTPDVVVIGMGEDGHIASLFPPLAEEAFGTTYVIHSTTDKFAGHDRISLTLPTLQYAKKPVFLLKGEGKKRVWGEMNTGSIDPVRWPAQAVLKEGRAIVITGN